MASAAAAFADDLVARHLRKKFVLGVDAKGAEAARRLQATAQDIEDGWIRRRS